jgi:hypothetical protein
VTDQLPRTSDDPPDPIPLKPVLPETAFVAEAFEFLRSGSGWRIRPPAPPAPSLATSFVVVHALASETLRHGHPTVSDSVRLTQLSNQPN